MKYRIEFRNEDDRNRIRKWAGMTPGASIIKRDDDWTIETSTISGFSVIEAYIVEVKNKKAEMLLKLQFADAKEHIEQSAPSSDRWVPPYLSEI